MAQHRVRGPNGAEAIVDVPRTMDQRTFDARVENGELTILDGNDGKPAGGASRKARAEYAASVTVDVSDEMGRDDIKAAVDDE